jgi:hypothetical protein
MGLKGSFRCSVRLHRRLFRPFSDSFKAKVVHNLHKRANARYKEGTARGFISPLRKAAGRIFGWHPSKDAKLHQGEVRRIPLPRTS